MKPRRIIHALCISFGLVLPAFAAPGPSYYVRASALQVVPKESGGFGSTTGALVAFGLKNEDYLGGGDQYETELGWAQWSESGTLISGSLKATGTEKLRAVPLLFTYRHNWALTDKLTLAVGPSLGFTQLQLSGSGTLTGPGGTVSGSLSDTDITFNYGVGLMLSFKATDSVSVDVGYRYLFSTTPKFFGASAGNFDTHLIQAGVSYRW